MMKKEIYCIILMYLLLYFSMACGNLFVSMDYDSVSERITSSIEDGEKELDKLKEEKTTMEEELNVYLQLCEFDDQDIKKKLYARFGDLVALG